MSSAPNLLYLVRGEDGVEYGPVDLSELREWVRENRAGLGTWVRYDGLNSAWQPWHDFPELVLLVAKEQAFGVVAGRPELAMASIPSRASAALIDLFFVAILMIATSFLVMPFLPLAVLQQIAFDSATSGFHTWDTKLPSYGFYFLPVFYFVFFAYYTGFAAVHGFTPGKQLLGIKIVNQWGVKPTMLQCLIRGSLWTLTFSFASGFFFLPFFYACFNFQRQSLHDFIAGTYVVRRDLVLPAEQV